MYFLEQKQFKPLMILLGIPFIPCIIGLICINIMDFNFNYLFILLIILLIYLTLIFVLWRLSKKKNNYILVKDDKVELEFHDSFEGKIKMELKSNQISKFEYYRINSIKGWLMIHSYVCPKCVFLTYNIKGEEQTKFIGYLDLEDIKEIAKITNSELVIY